MVKKTLEELTRCQLQEELRIRSQPVGGSKKRLQQRVISDPEEGGTVPATEVFEVVDARSTVDPLRQILEKLAAADHHFPNLTATANQQKEHLTAISAKTVQHQEELAALNVKIKQRLSTLTAKNDQQKEDLNALTVKTEQQMAKLRQKTSPEIQQNVLPLQQRREKLED